MAVPKKRISSTRRDKRRAHDALTPPTLVKCPHCKQLRAPHRVCQNCGYYNGKEVVIIKE